MFSKVLSSGVLVRVFAIALRRALFNSYLSYAPCESLFVLVPIAKSFVLCSYYLLSGRSLILVQLGL